MYSYEERIQAVKLYIKLGKRTGATIRQLGYPTKNVLKSWHREYEQGHDLPVGYARSKPKYSNEQKKVAAQHYLDHGRCLVGTLTALGYPCRETLAAWIDAQYPKTRIRVVVKAAGALRSPELKQAAVIELCIRQSSAEFCLFTACATKIQKGLQHVVFQVYVAAELDVVEYRHATK